MNWRRSSRAVPKINQNNNEFFSNSIYGLSEMIGNNVSNNVVLDRVLDKFIARQHTRTHTLPPRVQTVAFVRYLIALCF